MQCESTIQNMHSIRQGPSDTIYHEKQYRKLNSKLRLWRRFMLLQIRTFEYECTDHPRRMEGCHTHILTSGKAILRVQLVREERADLRLDWSDCAAVTPAMDPKLAKDLFTMAKAPWR